MSEPTKRYQAHRGRRLECEGQTYELGRRMARRLEPRRPGLLPQPPFHSKLLRAVVVVGILSPSERGAAADQNRLVACGYYLRH